MTGLCDWDAFALLLIDVQCDFRDDDQIRNFPDFSANIERLLRFCRSEGIEIVHIRALFAPDSSDWMAKYTVKGSIPCVRGTEGAETLPFALAAPGEIEMEKQAFDAFHIPGLVSHLHQAGKRFLLTAGLLTSVCVFLTTASAAQRGFLTAMVTDCCADEPEAHESTLKRYPFIFD
ncbi:uncharacterized protein METZ01_LOCUS436036, partial [marine metagenome]